MTQKRLSYKYVKGLVEDYNERHGFKYKDRGYLNLGGDSGWYELDVQPIQGSTAVRMIERGTLKECYDALYRWRGLEDGN